MLHKNAPAFSFDDCSFKVQKQKSSCARVVVRQELGLLNSFTMEASFAGKHTCGRRMMKRNRTPLKKTCM